MAPDEWTETEVEDLKAAINDGLSVERRKFSTELTALMRSSRSVESWDWSRKSANHE